MRKGPMLYLDVSGSTLEPVVVQTAEQIFSAKDAEIARLRAKIAAVAEALHDAAAEIAPLRAEIQRLKSTLAQLAASGTGYSQQTVDAIVKERDALRARVIELKTSRYDGGDEHM